MSLQDWLYLSAICFLGACSPGPSLLVVLGFVSSEGKWSGFSFSVGHGVAVFSYALLSTLGLGVLMSNYYLVFSIVQIAGAFFLLWIAFKIIINSFDDNGVGTNFILKKKNNNNRFIEGFLVAILNPKIAIFFLSLFSQFLSPDQGILLHIFMALVAGGIDTFVYCSIVFLTATETVSNLLARYRKQVGLIFGSLLVLLSFSLFFSLLY